MLQGLSGWEASPVPSCIEQMLVCIVVGVLFCGAHRLVVAASVVSASCVVQLLLCSRCVQPQVRFAASTDKPGIISLRTAKPR